MIKKSRRLNQKHAVTVIGCGNWGTAIASVIAANLSKLSDFEEYVNLWVFNDDTPGISLSDYINKNHVNYRYAPNIPLPNNVIAVADVLEATMNSDYLIFAIPNYFVVRCCKTLVGRTKPQTQTLFVLRGLDNLPGSGVTLLQPFVLKTLKLSCSILTGMNFPSQVELGQPSDLTIACRDPAVADIWCLLLENDLIKVTVSNDMQGVELCIGLRNIVSFAAGCFDGFIEHESHKTVVIRLGVMDIIRYMDFFYPQCRLSTIFLTCGIPELIMLSYGSRTRRLAELAIIKSYPLPYLENKFLDGIRVPGPRLVRKLYQTLRDNKVAEKFPVFVTVYQFVKYRDRDVIFDLVLKTRVDVVHPDRMKPL